MKNALNPHFLDAHSLLQQCDSKREDEYNISVKDANTMSVQILLQRNEYYTILEQTQKGNLDITKDYIGFLKTY